MATRSETNLRKGDGQDTPTWSVAPLLLGKLSPPLSTSNEVRRAHLEARFFEPRIEQFTWVNAPAGYGKTTTLAQWYRRAVESGWIAGWVTLDEDDRNARQFVRCLNAAFLRAYKQSLPLPEVTATAVIPERALRTFLLKIEQTKRPFLLFLDDVQRAQSRASGRILTQLLRGAPSNLHLVMASRGEMPVRIARYRCEGRLDEVTIEDLTFRKDEAKTYFGGVLPDADVVRLLNRAEGWPIALQLMWLRIQRQGEPGEIASFSGRSRALADYLVDQVFSDLPYEQQEFLMSTAVLSRVSADVATALTGRSDGREMLEELERRHLFLIQLDEERRWYRYHHMFAEFLEDRLTRKSSRLKEHLNKRAAEWFVSDGQIREGVRHALAVADDRFVAELIDRHGGMELALRHGTPVLRGVERVPFEIATEYPAFALAQSYCFMQNRRFRESEAVLDGLAQRSRNFQALSFSNQLQAKMIELLLVIYLDRPFHRDVVNELEAALENASTDIPDVLRPALSTIICCAQFGLDNHVGCRGWGEKGLLECKNAGAAYAENYCRYYIGMSALTQAQLTTSEKRFVDALEHAERLLGEGSNQAAIARILLAEVRYEQDRLDDATGLLSSLPAAEELTDAWFCIYASLFRTRASLFARTRTLGACVSAIESGCETARQLHLPRLVTSLKIHLVRELARGGHIVEADAALAEEVVQEALRGSDVDSRTRQLRQDASEADVAVKIAKGDYRAAQEQLPALIQAAAGEGRLRRLLKLWIMEAVVLDALGEHQAALDAFSKAIRQGAPEGFVRIFLDEGVLVRRLAVSLVTQNAPRSQAEAQLLQRLITGSSAGVQVAASATTPSNNHVHLSPREQEVLLLLGHGYSSKEMANTVGVAESTIKFYRRNLYKKLDVQTRAQAVAAGRNLSLS